MPVVYEAAHRRECCAAITALANRIGLYAGSTRVGTVYGDTTWGTPVDVDGPAAQSTGSTVTITIPGGTVADGTVIDGYGIFAGNTLKRRNGLPVTLTVASGAQEAQVDVTPIYRYRGEGETA